MYVYKMVTKALMKKQNKILKTGVCKDGEASERERQILEVLWTFDRVTICQKESCESAVLYCRHQLA